VPEPLLKLGPATRSAAVALGQLGHHLAAAARGGAAGAEGGTTARPRAGRLRLGFWSADWTPWPAIARLRRDWPALRFDVRPRYDDAG
jgi:hypothetical protein